MIAKILFRFDQAPGFPASQEEAFKKACNIHEIRKHIRNADLFVDVDVPTEFKDVYQTARKVRQGLAAAAGREPRIVRIQTFNE